MVTHRFMLTTIADTSAPDCSCTPRHLQGMALMTQTSERCDHLHPDRDNPDEQGKRSKCRGFFNDSANHRKSLPESNIQGTVFYVRSRVMSTKIPTGLSAPGPRAAGVAGPVPIRLAFAVDTVMPADRMPRLYRHGCCTCGINLLSTPSCSPSSR